MFAGFPLPRAVAAGNVSPGGSRNDDGQRERRLAPEPFERRLGVRRLDGRSPRPRHHEPPARVLVLGDARRSRGALYIRAPLIRAPPPKRPRLDAFEEPPLLERVRGAPRALRDGAERPRVAARANDRRERREGRRERAPRARHANERRVEETFVRFPERRRRRGGRRRARGRAAREAVPFRRETPDGVQPRAKRSFFFGGSSEERRDDDASARAAGGGSGSDGDASGSDDFGPSSDEEGESLAGARSGADASAPKRKGSTRTVRTTTTRTILRRDGSAVETSESRESREGGEGGGAGAAAGASGPSAGSSSVDGVDNLAELEALRAEIKRLEVELEKERQACFTLRAERVAWRAERSDMLEERDRLMEGAASTAKIFDGGDPESAAHESLAALVFALRGEDLAFDAVKIAKRADDVARSGAVAAVLGAMATHRDSERVQAAGAEALRAMAERSDHARTQLLKEPEEMLGRGGGVPALVGAMRANPDSAEVASAAGRALIAVAREKGEEGRRAIENARGREAIVAAAKKHPGEMSYADQAEELCAWLVAAF
jgi:hypothetical protein